MIRSHCACNWIFQFLMIAFVLSLFRMFIALQIEWIFERKFLNWNKLFIQSMMILPRYHRPVHEHNHIGSYSECPPFLKSRWFTRAKYGIWLRKSCTEPSVLNFWAYGSKIAAFSSSQIEWTFETEFLNWNKIFISWYKHYKLSQQISI